MPFPDALPPPADESDKHMHALTGAAVRFGGESLMPDAPPGFARLLLPAAAGLAKEAADRYAIHGDPDWKDAAATALGAAMAYRDDRHGLTVVPTISDDMVALDVLLRF